ncbi:flagellar biosynthesis anti-sigma factor FlgM [Shewanella intestini]|uniref:Negative regulator of flagellin synthesis n=1 Tax=Shewanella intestini TaxID=2017544 RepID=A0ABS5HY77_9GAMM|nr:MULTISPECIES: flagellar biosynthesis anti-sigma factor FlgM [Shewanella]MBR9726743.1 flagellar biosynthesis anti-sigma factor FlgM [Shewanella intestini]MRG34691.1 flagellar biosynthesis anti-sigma factor FlgM [Shewanella sp. XMDDZSB0408]
MAININKLKTATSTPVHTARQAKENHEAGNAKAQGTSTPVKTDSVSITSQAHGLQSAQSKMASLPDVNQAKIDEIKQAISDGKYKVDPEKLAANIANFESELNGLSVNKE